MKPRYWVETEDGGVRPATIEEFASLLDPPDGVDKRKVAYDTGDDFRVSTVFLGIDHGFVLAHEPNAAPVLYETMVFRSDEDIDCRRYCTREEALAGHAAVCRAWLGRGPQPPDNNL